MANRVDPDQTEQFDLSLLCLPRPACPKTEDYSGNCIKNSEACYEKPRFKRPIFNKATNILFGLLCTHSGAVTESDVGIRNKHGNKLLFSDT